MPEGDNQPPPQGAPRWRSCTKCGARLVWNNHTNKWIGDHEPACPVMHASLASVPALPEAVAVGLEDIIGPDSQPLWDLTVHLSAERGRVTERMQVRARTRIGAIALGFESRLLADRVMALEVDPDIKELTDE